MSTEIWMMSIIAVAEYWKCKSVARPARHALHKSRTTLAETSPLEDFVLYRAKADQPSLPETTVHKAPPRRTRSSYPVGFSPMRRGSIASESISEEGLCWAAPKIYKSEETKEKLAQILRKNILMQHLSVENLAAIVDALAKVELAPGQIVVREGDQGDGSYIVQEGVLRCTMSGIGHRCYYESGESFGEISLMYGNVRAATITAQTASVVWKLDRETFKKIIQNAMMPTHSAFLKFIKEVEVLRKMSEEEKDRVVKSSQRLAYSQGSQIVSQGSDSVERYMYLIISGTVQFAQGTEVLCRKRAFQYFGERSILWDENPQATAIAEENTEVYRVPATVLKSLPPSLLDELRKNAEHI